MHILTDFSRLCAHQKKHKNKCLRILGEFSLWHSGLGIRLQEVRSLGSAGSIPGPAQ